MAVRPLTWWYRLLLADGSVLSLTVCYRPVSTALACINNQILLVLACFWRFQLGERFVNLAKLGMIDDATETCRVRAQV